MSRRGDEKRKRRKKEKKEKNIQETANTVVASDVIIMIMTATFAQDNAIVLAEER